MRKDLQEAEDRVRKAEEEFRLLREGCSHPAAKQIWKSKYGGYFCTDCEVFLPRTIKRKGGL